MRTGLNAYHGTSVITGVREGPNDLTLLYSWELQGPDGLGPRLLSDAMFTPVRKLLPQKYFLTWLLR